MGVFRFPRIVGRCGCCSPVHPPCSRHCGDKRFWECLGKRETDGYNLAAPQEYEKFPTGSNVTSKQIGRKGDGCQMLCPSSFLYLLSLFSPAGSHFHPTTQSVLNHVSCSVLHKCALPELSVGIERRWQWSATSVDGSQLWSPFEGGRQTQNLSITNLSRLDPQPLPNWLAAS